MRAEGPDSLFEAGVDLRQHCSITGREPVPDATIESIRAHHVYCAIQPIAKKCQDRRRSANMSEDESTPLDDLRDVRKIATAMKDGVVVDRASPPIHRALTER